MNARNFQEWLKNTVESQSDGVGDDIAEIQTFDEAGILSNNNGLVFYFPDEDCEFQVTIIKSR